MYKLIDKIINSLVITLISITAVLLLMIFSVAFSPENSSEQRSKAEIYYTNSYYVKTVWVVENGKKYHSNPNCSNMKEPIKITEAEAEGEGYTPCKNCYY